ncbi:MAG: hypothetical protein A2157_11870 [Deltaproteobacteria bacterium RBG_16_47_11]|nr:MAG: hypothetical protein A2157_11870 [Deltaproteobacteria bacterium RBG_16_47_11]
MSKIKEILERKDKRKVKLLGALDSIVRQLKDMGALKIILFGSVARGDTDVNSDLDLFVLMPSSRPGKEWMDIIYETVERRVASNLIVFNQREFDEKLSGNRFLQNILKGRVVYEKAT